MSVDRVNSLNIVLVLVSCAAAFALPFELFLFSYAVLGPLHYLTQISWMHKRRYFTRSGARFDPLLLAGLALLVAAIARFAPEVEGWRPELGGLAATAMSWTPTLTFVALGAAVLMVVLESTRAKLIGIGALLLGAGLLSRWPHYGVTFDLFLPTIIHVCVFTAAFILVGALKGRNLSGVALLAVFAACGLSFFVWAPEAGAYAADEVTRQRYQDGQFWGLNVWLSNLFYGEPFANFDLLYASSTGLVIGRFIAFCYTYHFLNWFSKTSVIRWHEVPRSWLATCVVLWIASLSLYAYDFALGAATLAFLSLVHVFLEFPLDCRAFATIGQELAALARAPRSWFAGGVRAGAPARVRR